MDGYRFSLPYSARVADINYGGHVSNAAVLNYFQDARIAYLAGLGPFSEFDIGEGCGIIVAEVRVRYLAEMFLGDALEIGVRVEELRNRSFTLGYRIEREGKATAEGTTSQVCFDYRERRPQALSPAFRQAVARLEGAPLS
jgi:YbgC/YbaW family acyl-CoA thioester hydrolase